MRLTGWVAGGVGLAALYCLFQLIIGPRFLLRRASGEEQDGNSHELLTWAQNHQGRALWKQNQYFDVYEQVLGQFRNRPNITLLQIGVHTGGAIDLWQQYFGKGFVFVGVDINPECAQFDNGKDVRIHIGSQSNSSFLTQVAKEIPKLDIVIDDGAHFSDISISTFTLLWPYLSPTQGKYVIEDLPGQHKVQNLFTDLAHLLRRSDPIGRCSLPDFPNFCQEAYSLSIFHNMAVWEKRTTKQPDRVNKFGGS